MLIDNAMTYAHTPVMMTEVLDALAPTLGATFVDATIGGGGHACAIAERILPTGHIIGIDADPAALAASRHALAQVGATTTTTCTLIHGNFRHLADMLQAHAINSVDGILLDLGVSSHQLDTPARGFSFQQQGALDMRLDPTQTTTAATLIAHLSEYDLADIFFRYGEERFSRRIARRIVAERDHRDIVSTDHLASLVARAIPSPSRKQHHTIHPATRTFQALRIAVNEELAALEEVLPQAVDVLRPGGRVAVISFHSLEDRIVKHFFREQARRVSEEPYGHHSDRHVVPHSQRVRIITKKPLVASTQERATNARSRSAKLRVAERVA